MRSAIHPKKQASRTEHNALADNLHSPNRVGSVFGNGVLARRNVSVGSRDVPESNLDLEELKMQKINYLGPDPEPNLRMLRLFFEVGKEFRAGACSLNDVGTGLENRFLNGCYPMRLAYATSSVRRLYEEVPVYFGNHFRLPGPAQLFYCGKANAVYGLTPLGEVAWTLTREFLLAWGTIEEND